MRTLLFTFAFLFCFSSYAQQRNKIDSLIKVAKVVKSPKQKALLHLELAKIYQRKSRDTSRFYSDTAEKIALEINDDSLLAATYFRQAYPEFYNSNDVVALDFYRKIDSLALKNKNLQQILIETKVYRSEISKFTFTMEGVLKAKDYLVEGLALAQNINDTSLKNKMKHRLGAWHGFISQEVAPEKHLDTARTMLLEVLPFFKRTNDLDMTAETYESLSTTYDRLGNLEKVFKYNDSLLSTLRKIGDSLRIGEAYYMRGTIYKVKGNPETGLTYLDSATAVYNKIGYPNNTEKKNLYRDYGYLYYKNGQYKKAFESMRKALIQSNQVYMDENVKSSIEMETKYESEKKQQEITLLKTENALAEQQKKNQRNLLLGGLGLTTVAGIFLFLGYRNRKKINDKLRELDATKSNFFANISHEFRTPLSLIAGPIEEQLQKPDLPPREKHNLQTAQRNSQRLVTLVDQLLDLSKLESGHFKLKVQQGKLGTFLKSLGSSFKFLAQEKGQDYDIQIDIPEGTYWFDADALEKIITNLLSNAIKYSPEDARVHFNAILLNGKLNLTVKNSGTTLSKDVLATLFNRFQRADEGSAGSGIGLALTKELVELHKGTITVKNENSEMTFEVQLPVTQKAFSEEEQYEGIIASSVNDENVGTYDDATSTTLSTSFAKADTSTTIASEEKDIFAKDNNPILLIVDDNKDLREYVRSLFQDTYTIHTAENGKTGFEIAKETVPDLIITDLMMPEEDGLVFTKNCKSTEATSHIPVLMLTAKAGDENQLKGLETGADAYITKPFNTEILKTTANNLLESRKKLQERFSQEVILLPKDIATNSIEEKFLENLQAVMDDKLIESDFNTEDFARALGMSRMQLHRKLKALTGLSATEFVRSQRLKLAAQLLKKSDINVSQVGYSIGFNNHSYFTKCFKEQYGVAPSEYAKKP